jgi:feruloyl esterase
VIVTRGSAFVAVALAAGFASDAGAQTPCENLGALALAGVRVTSAATVASGALAPPAGLSPFLAGDASTYKGLPAFCRVQLSAAPSSDSDIRIEVWLPATGWNGRLQSVGNGGFGGSIGYRSLAKLLAHGFATAATDTGHQASFIEAGWALGHPEKVADFGHRAVHEMTRAAQAAILAFYGKAAHHSYFSSCSNGGRQALMEAQRYPEDYDGILAGAPANAWTRLLTSAVYDAQITTGDAASYIPSSKLPAIARAVEAACDVQDGVRDGILGDPRRCRFEPATLLCKDADAPSCLTSAQAKALEALYEGAHDTQGRRIFPGFVPGAEEGDGGWEAWITGRKPGDSLLFGFGYGYFANMVYEKADWSYKTARLDDALAAADQKTGHAVDAVDPDLARFHERGGKLVIYHGWNDPAISARNSIDYYDSVVAALGADPAASFLRLYMIPGVQHCGDGPGTTSYDSLESDPHHSLGLALQSWVEGGAAPSAVIATRYEGEGSAATGAKVLMTRPLCPYPQSARYRGTGDTSDAASFECAAP